MRQHLICLDIRGGIPRPLDVPPARSVLCLGNFDGVHRAHAALLTQGQALTRAINAATPELPPALCGVFCFDSLSGDHFLKEGDKRNHLTILKERLRAFSERGIEIVWLCDFPTIQHLSPEAFCELLTAECGCVGAACGYNYRFGRKAAGTPELLTRRLGQDRTVILPAMTEAGIPVSSSRIRAALLEGDMETAALLLGRPYALYTTVMHGKSLGHTWGFPTANQFFPVERLIPPYGVYAVRCHTPTGIFPGVANVGLRPTVDIHGRVNCETHIIGYQGDLYGRRLKIEFLKFLRPEQRFGSVEALKEAIRTDTAAAAAYIASLDAPVTP